MRDQVSQHIFLTLICLNAFLLPGNAQNKYVSTSGDDLNSGSISAPFKTIQKGVESLYPGDTLFIRGGSYHEEVLIDQKRGTQDFPIHIMAHQEEEVILDGTIPIETPWTLHDGNIYKTTIEEDIWQFFVDGRMQVIARWPNASTHPVDPFERKPGSWEAVDGTWWSKETTWANADAPGTENGVVENNDAYHNLAATGKSFTGGSVILSVLEQGGDGNLERPITEHIAGTGTFTHPVVYPPKPDKAYRDDRKYYLVEHLSVLDKEEEWYYIDSINTVYLWLKDSSTPENHSFRGRNISRFIEIKNSSFITIKGLHFFASNFSAQGTNITIEDCEFKYPDASKRLLGEYAINSLETSQLYGTTVDGENFSLINCTFEYTEYSVLQVLNGTNSLIHNNLFSHLSMLGCGNNGAIEQVNTYTRNTFRVAGNRGAVKTNNDPISGRIQNFNLFESFGFLQVPDGASLQVATNNTPGTIRSYNWFTYALKYGSRWDGHPAGVQGTNHHQVGLMVKGTIQSKGDDHSTYNNSSFFSQEQNGIIILSDPSYGGNLLSRTHNNLADKISGHRSASVSSFPIPGSNSHNWNGYNETGYAAALVYDINNQDFRPRPGSALVDAGMLIPGYTDGFFGEAPDIGAYEFGDTVYWIPGRQSEIASHPIPNNQGTSNYEFVDLMWLQARNATSSDVYFGSSYTAVENADKQSEEYKGQQTNNIYYPGALSAGEKYYWRIDEIADGKTKKGEVWSFTAGTDANPRVYKVRFKLYGKQNNTVSPLPDCNIRLNKFESISNDTGSAELSMIKAGMYYISYEKTDYHPHIDSVYISSDTLIIDTLEAAESYKLLFQIEDLSSGKAVYNAAVRANDKIKFSDTDGNALLDKIPPGEVIADIEHNNYFKFQDTIMLANDTTIHIYLTPLYAVLAFNVSDNDGPLPNAKITLDPGVTYTDVNGMTFYYIKAREKYHYSAEKEDYEILKDSLWLETDTTISVTLQKETGLGSAMNQTLAHYPNPASETLYINIPDEDGLLKIVRPEGRVLLFEKIRQGTNTVDITMLDKGLYIIHLQSEDHDIKWIQLINN